MIEHRSALYKEHEMSITFRPNVYQKINDEIYVYDFISMFGNIGGSFGFFFGISLFDLICLMIENGEGIFKDLLKI